MDFMKRRAPSSAVEAVKNWTATDRHTVVAHLKHRSVEMNSLWIYILPKHVWKAADTKNWEKFEPPLPLVGSGPYTVTNWNPNGTTVLEKNPYFRRANTGPGARADDLLRRRQRRRHRSRAEPPRRDAERHAGRARRHAAAAHERRARLPVARRSASSTGSSTWPTT